VKPAPRLCHTVDQIDELQPDQPHLEDEPDGLDVEQSPGGVQRAAVEQATMLTVRPGPASEKDKRTKAMPVQ
jgi:hypothetical protein